VSPEGHVEQQGVSPPVVSSVTEGRTWDFFSPLTFTNKASVGLKHEPTMNINQAPVTADFV